MSSLNISVLTLFPQLIDQYFSESIFGAAQESGILQIDSVDFRKFSDDKHNSVDDMPFGGGPGMVLCPQPIIDCIDETKPPKPVIYLSPAGETFNQKLAEELVDLGEFSLLCGRYEGLDQRVRDTVVDREISIGDFVLAGGEAAAISIIEATARLVPGVVGNESSPVDESFANDLIEYPQYTRPAEFRGLSVPEVLRSGNHELVDKWRLAKSLAITSRLRPDLIEQRGGLTPSEAELLADFEL